MPSSTDIVFAATEWNTNADMIADCARLGYIKPLDKVLDPTYGKGNWWTKYRPAAFWSHDLDPDGIDFRRMPHADQTFDVVAYDPPYVCVGGRTTTGLPEMHAAYGLTDAPTSPADLQLLINDGLKEVLRVTKPKGIVLVKCQDYVSSGKLWLGTHHTLTYALALGFECWDRLEHIAGPRPQPARPQQHARRNLSTLFVLKAPK